MARLVAWIDADQELLLRAVVDRADLELTAVGSATADAGALAQSLDTERLPELRDAALHADAEIVWVASMSGAADSALHALRESRRRWVSSEPIPDGLYIPHLRRSPGFVAAAEMLESIGDVVLVSACLASGPGEGSLLSRLFDGFDLVDVLCGQPETVDATYVPATPRAPAESLSDLDGHMTVNLRFADRRCASITATNHGGGWSRRITLVGRTGALRFDDHAVEWPDADPSAPDAPPADLIARQIRRVLDRLDESAPSPATDRLLAWCEAARLSSRTGSNEAPGSVMEMLSRV